MSSAPAAVKACRTALEARCSSAATVPSGRKATPAARAPLSTRTPPEPAAGAPSASRTATKASLAPAFPATASRPSGASAIAVAASFAVPPPAGKVTDAARAEPGIRGSVGQPAHQQHVVALGPTRRDVGRARDAQMPVREDHEVGRPVVARARRDGQGQPAVAGEPGVERPIEMPGDDGDVEAAARSRGLPNW